MRFYILKPILTSKNKLKLPPNSQPEVYTIDCSCKRPHRGNYNEDLKFKFKFKFIYFTHLKDNYFKLTIIQR